MLMVRIGIWILAEMRPSRSSARCGVSERMATALLVSAVIGRGLPRRSGTAALPIHGASTTSRDLSFTSTPGPGRSNCFSASLFAASDCFVAFWIEHPAIRRAGTSIRLMILRFISSFPEIVAAASLDDQRRRARVLVRMQLPIRTKLALTEAIEKPGNRRIEVALAVHRHAHPEIEFGIPVERDVRLLAPTLQDLLQHVAGLGRPMRRGRGRRLGRD